MRKTLRMLFVVCLSCLLLMPMTSLAAEESVSSNDHQASVKITDTETGKTQVYYVTPFFVQTRSTSLNLGYDIFIPLDDPQNITPLDTSGGTQNRGGITATLYVNYDINSTNEQVRLNRVYGGWAPSASMYYVTDRVVGAHSGIGTGKKVYNIS